MNLASRILVLTLLLFWQIVLTQNKKEVDSLLKIYNSDVPIKERMYALDDLVDLYIYTKPDIAKNYIDNMLTMSKEANFKHGILRSCLLYTSPSPRD